MNSIGDVSALIGRVVKGLEAGTLDVKTASELNNSAGKAIKLRATQLEYHAMRKESPEIPFWKESVAA
jgi:hypothetical protein